MPMFVVFWGGVIALIVWAVRRPGGGGEVPRTALDIARERLARGELTKEELTAFAATLHRQAGCSSQA